MADLSKYCETLVFFDLTYMEHILCIYKQGVPRMGIDANTILYYPKCTVVNYAADSFETVLNFQYFYVYEFQIQLRRPEIYPTCYPVNSDVTVLWM